MRQVRCNGSESYGFILVIAKASLDIPLQSGDTLFRRAELTGAQYKLRYANTCWMSIIEFYLHWMIVLGCGSSIKMTAFSNCTQKSDIGVGVVLVKIFQS